LLFKNKSKLLKLKKTIDGTRALIDLFWDEPREWNGDKFGYQLNCSIQQENNEPAQYANATLKGTQRSFSFAVRSGKIQCFVFAMNDQRLMGPPSNLIEIDGSGLFREGRILNFSTFRIQTANSPFCH
jgi:hypothetical protein